MDDVWGDDGDEHNAGKAERYDVERDSHKLKEEHIAVGYREAVDEAKETTLQEGFNVGYADAILLGFQLGKLQGLLR
ncbi:hypothetical protein M427DRAFT_30061 [Gonapodya prolifera JEL478]|uniref:Protein YAE1 n=1 Tax=Gonapodya prolifera (strain JEL478) TaxID=1344416 RepID=A0A139AME9_GONPJ|nr:hypothetical protein M427DRAFT_30061 [Gonapodya prolifera JEL478]|eukprot:KXS17942.1 hypothetical protein M427DRAFT_30061 [Gonapodya prolifera JEL478]